MSLKLRAKKASVTFHTTSGVPFVVETLVMVTKPGHPGAAIHACDVVTLRPDREDVVLGYTVKVGRRSNGYREFDDRTPIRLFPGDRLNLRLHPDNLLEEWPVEA